MTCRDSFMTLATLLVTAPAAAGVIVQEVQEQTGVSFGARGPSGSHTQMELSAEGDGMRSDILKSDSPLTPAGSYMLFPNDELIYLVNPANKTYVLMDMVAMSGLQQQGRPPPQSGGGSRDAQDLVIEKKLDEAGPVMIGLPTQHVVYEISYHRPSPAQMPGIVTSMEVHEKYEIWATHGLEAQLTNAPALRKSALRMAGLAGGAQPKQVGEALAGYGFVLKQVVTVESKMGGATGPMALLMHVAQGGQKQSSSSVITAIRYEPLQPERFVLPQGYTEVGMMNPNMGTMPDLSQLPGRPGQAPPSGSAQPPPGGQPPQMPDLNDIPK